MKTLKLCVTWAMILLPVLSVFLYAAFDYRWWMPMDTPGHLFRAAILVVLHGALLTIGLALIAVWWGDE
jgi:hypothetical protein